MTCEYLSHPKADIKTISAQKGTNGFKAGHFLMHREISHLTILSVFDTAYPQNTQRSWGFPQWQPGYFHGRL